MCAQNNRNQQIEPMKITTLVKNPQIIARASSCFGPATILFSLVLFTERTGGARSEHLHNGRADYSAVD